MMNKNNPYCLLTTTLAGGLGIVSSAIASTWILHRFDYPTTHIGLYNPAHPPSSLSMGGATLEQQNLILSAVAPHSLSLMNEQFKWRITSTLTKKVYTLQGAEQRIDLPAGRYDVTLMIGRYRSTKAINLSANRQQQEIFVADIGRISAKANEQVVWRIYPLDGNGEPIVVNSADEPSTAMSEIVGSGLYKVDAELKSLHRAERIRLNKGKQVLSTLFIPAGKVNLIATRDNAPLFKPTIWNIFRIENGEKQPVPGTYNRHTQAVIIPPGHYEAVAKSENKTRTREFWVGSGATNDVQVSMDD